MSSSSSQRDTSGGSSSDSRPLVTTPGTSDIPLKNSGKAQQSARLGSDNSPNPLINLLTIDDDPIFRLGLRTALGAFPEVQIVAEAETATEAFAILSRLSSEVSVDAIVLDFASDRTDSNSLSGLPLCQRLKAEYPNLPVLLLTAESEPLLLRAAKEAGIEGYCPKGCTTTQIIQAIRQIISGQSYWQLLPPLPPLPIHSVSPPSWHHKMRSYGLRQIEDTLALVTRELQKPILSNVDWLYWSGRRRELLAARWIVNQFLPADVIVVEQESKRVGGVSPSTSERRPAIPTLPRSLASRTQSPTPNPQLPSPDRQIPAERSLSPTNSSSLSPQQVTPFDVTLAKLQSDLSNNTGVPLEIDILTSEKKQDLLYLVLQKFEEILEELRFSQVSPDQLPQKRWMILQDLWQASLTDFFGKYYTLPVGNQNLEVVDILMRNVGVVQSFILDKIPLVIELISHQLFTTHLIIDNVPYPAQTPEALARAEILLQNLIIQVANAVIQPLLNEFADIELIKQSFYDRHLISSREIARLRNNLSWRYRTYYWLSEPIAIFESKYHLFILNDTGIKQISIYAPRRQELERLQGIQLAVTLAYEARDAIAPRLRSTVAWVGKGVVYVLTQVIGRSIGLVVRGVIQGIGSTLQDARFGKNGERGK